jgi:hypothetical protein
VTQQLANQLPGTSQYCEQATKKCEQASTVVTTTHEPSLVRNSWAVRLKLSVVWCWKSR